MTDRLPRHDEDHPFFGEMREQILATPLPAGPRGWPRRRWRRGSRAALRPAPLAGVGAAFAAAVTGLVLLLSAGSSPPPAYAVTVNADRTVTVHLREFRAIRKLNARLAALHTRIRAVPVVPGCVAPVYSTSDAFGKGYKKVLPGPPRTLQALRPDGLVIGYETISVDTLPGRTFIIPVTRSGLELEFAPPQSGVVVGPAPRCVGESRQHS